MLENFFMELTAVIVLATVLGALFRRIKQPIILAYIVSGILLGASFLDFLSFNELLNIFSELGIVFLLFLVGINLDPRIIKEVGKSSVITGLGQIVFTTLAGFWIAHFLGFGILESLYIAIALTFSSTIIIVKLLSDKKELNSLYGKISIGFLLVQDLVAVLALILISSLSFSNNIESELLRFAGNLVLLFIFFIIAQRFIVRHVFNELANNQELLFLGSIAWGFLFTSATIALGFSKEIGAFLAGISIASLPYTHNILGKVKYLRDFFLTLFFVVLGSNFILTSSSLILEPAIIFSIFVLVGNPIIVYLLMTWLGYKSRTSFLSGLTVAQISEFSLILIFLGHSVGHVSEEAVSIITLVAIITIAVSAYLIMYSNRLYEKVVEFIPVLRNKNFFEDTIKTESEKTYDVVCIGFGETGKKILSKEKAREKTLVIDFNPSHVKEAKQRGLDSLYGDAYDLETIEHILEKQPKIIISTIMNLEANAVLAKKLEETKIDANLIVLAHNEREAKKLYKEGVEFVLLPSTLAAEIINNIIKDIEEKNTFELEMLKRIKLGNGE